MDELPDLSPDPEDDTDLEPLEVLRRALQTFVNTQRESATLVDNALIVWEEVGFDDDGDAQRRVSYTVPTENFSLSGTLGLLEAASEYVRRDILGTRDDG